MTKQDLIDRGLDEVVMFENPSFDGCIIGVSTDLQAIYSLSQMIEWYCKENNCSNADAADFINYNTMRALGYIPNHPIILDDVGY